MQQSFGFFAIAKLFVCVTVYLLLVVVSVVNTGACNYLPVKSYLCNVASMW